MEHSITVLHLEVHLDTASLALTELNLNAFTGPDKLHQLGLKRLAYTIAPLIHHIFFSSSATSELPVA